MRRSGRPSARRRPCATPDRSGGHVLGRGELGGGRKLVHGRLLVDGSTTGEMRRPIVRSTTSLRRHDPDQVQRVRPAPSQPRTGHPSSKIDTWASPAALSRKAGAAYDQARRAPCAGAVALTNRRRMTSPATTAQDPNAAPDAAEPKVEYSLSAGLVARLAKFSRVDRLHLLPVGHPLFLRPRSRRPTPSSNRRRQADGRLGRQRAAIAWRWPRAPTSCAFENVLEANERVNDRFDACTRRGP